jgi:hypothetical protein
MHEKRHRFSANLEISIIQENDERFKSKRMNKNYKKRKHLLFWLTKFEHSSISLKIDEYFATNEFTRSKKKRDEILRYKTRWVIRKFEQIEKLDYTKTFISMIKSMN